MKRTIIKENHVNRIVTEKARPENTYEEVWDVFRFLLYRDIFETGFFMTDYRAQAERILELVGGKENVVSLTRCFTRLRFVLKDFEAAQTEELKKLEDVRGILKRTGSYQVVIGMAVSSYYKELEQLC